jgi:2-polyprenyl-6-methoxyphenol hydroxylase-like FAD-dependent oxidoreductase
MDRKLRPFPERRLRRDRNRSVEGKALKQRELSGHPVIIAGGGPAGAAVALALKKMDIPCLVVCRPNPRRRYEGLSVRTADLLERLGLAQARASLGRPALRDAHWNGVRSRHNTEFLVERSCFDAALLRDLRAAAIRVVETELKDACKLDGGGWEARVEGQLARTPFLVDARGRAAPFNGDPELRGPSTVALCRLFEGPRGADATSVHPFAEGWAWLGCSSAGIAAAQFTLSAEAVSLAGKDGLTALHDHWREQLAAVAEWLPAGSRPLAPPFVRDCASILRRDLANPHYLRVGDAACALDPLSGQGVFLALAGALAAAAVVNTCVNRPGDAGLAAQFFARRARQQFLERGALGRDFYAAEQRWADRPFWRARSQWPPTAPVPDQAVTRERRPVLEEGWVVEREVLVTPQHPMGVWRVDDVPVAPLADFLAASKGQSFDATAYADRFSLAPASVARAVHWLRQSAGIGA